MTPVPPDPLLRPDSPGPGYTSYPTADRFVEAFTAADYAQALAHWKPGPGAPSTPLALQIHVPSCESLCTCSARTLTQHQGRGAPYLRYLAQEVDLHTAWIGTGQTALHLHLVRGTPALLPDDQLGELMAMVRRSFLLAAGGDCSVEIEPRRAGGKCLAALAAVGFKRISFGAQVADPGMQGPVQQIQPAGQVSELLEEARSVGFESINVDLVRGLPGQTPQGFARALEQVCRLRPDRITLHDHACEADLSKLRTLQDAGYEHIGMHHFALPHDALAVARRQGRLHRGFEGYITRTDGDMIGLGVAAMGCIGTTYSQNAKTMQEYCGHLDQGGLPVVRGLALGRDDLARRTIIMALMCQGQVLFEAIEAAWLLDFKRYFAAELDHLHEFSDHGWVVVDGGGIDVTPSGWFVVQAIAKVFDRYLQADRNRARFSRLI